jgi:hypothetical protein
MKPTALLFAVFMLIVVDSVPRTASATIPFTENFASNVSNWTTGGGTPATFQATGGPDGSSYASVTFTLANIPYSAPIVMFRGQDEFNSSNHAFEGDWLASGINRFSAYVWHNAPVSLGFFVRFAPPNNFPGTIAEDGTSVPPNTWTKLSYNLSPDKIDQYIFTEGPSSYYYETLSNVGHVQVGFRVPDGFNSDLTTYVCAMDQPSIERLVVPGDYNGNGVVDAADYVLWRKGGPLLNQIDDPSQVNAQDYSQWRARFSSTLAGPGGGSIANAPIPEPSAIVLFLLGFMASARTGCRSNRRVGCSSGWSGARQLVCSGAIRRLVLLP